MLSSEPSVGRNLFAIITLKITDHREVPGGPVVKTLCLHCRGTSSIPGWGTTISHATWHGQGKKKKITDHRSPQQIE